MASDMTQLETLFLALADRTRLRLLSLLASGPLPVGLLVDLTGESQPKVSRHLAYLRNCGIVTTRREGKQVFYGIDLTGDSQTARMLTAVIGSLTGKPERPASPPRERAAGPISRPTVTTDTYAEPNMNGWKDDELFEMADAGGETSKEREEMEVFLL